MHVASAMNRDVHLRDAPQRIKIVWDAGGAGRPRAPDRSQPDVAEHRRTFRRFATGMVLVAAHALVILAILDLLFRW